MKNLSKKKLIIFMPSIDDGGVEKNLFIISNFLSKKIKNTSIITLAKKYKKKFNDSLNFIAPKKDYFNNLSRRLKFIIALFFLFNEIKKNKKRNINSLVLCFQGHAYAIILCKILKIQIIIRSNSSPSGWSKNIIKQYLYKKIYSLADKIIVNSKEFQNEMKLKFQLKTHCIYNPLNKTEIIKKSKKKINFQFFSKNTINLIFVGRLNEQKNPLFLLKVIKKISSNLKIKLLLIGNGNEKSKLLNFVNENKLSNIKLKKFTENPFPFIKKADLLVLPSKYEGLPNILLEAMALKKAILSSNCKTGPKEILENGKAGLLYKNLNENDFIKKLNYFINNQKIIQKKIDYGFKKINKFDYFENLNKYFLLLKKNIISSSRNY